MRLVECVPNFSEGKDRKVIDSIAQAIQSVEGVELLDVDPGPDANRTVMTLVGSPEAALEAAFQAIAQAARLIDMRQHRGTHPRIGATDVCPFIPIAGVTMQQCVELSRQLGQRVGQELGIPVYLYAEAAPSPDRASLADIRQGQYEGLKEKMEAGFQPDFGPSKFNALSGATVIGARPFLIAYNVNLNTRSQKLAQELALRIREAGRYKRDAAGKPVLDSQGQKVMVPGTLKACRAVGWYIDEYQRAQVSINLLDYKLTSLHQAFDEVCRQAQDMGLRATGSEIVGLVPLEPMLEAGRHYLSRQGRCTGVPDAELITMAVQSLGLAELALFEPAKKVLEYRMASKGRPLQYMTLSDFIDELSRDSPAPGGGSVAALCGCLSAALSSMVATLTFDKRGFEDVRPLMDNLSNRAQQLKTRFLQAVDADTQAFQAILNARRMPQSSPAEKDAREQALSQSQRQATLVPLAVLKDALEALSLAQLVVEQGNPNSLSDGGVAGLTAGAAAEAAYYNVLINLGDFTDKEFCQQTQQEAELLIEQIRQQVQALNNLIQSRLQPTGSNDR